jgi:2,3-diketo-5-methylthio-1-phosphopentane phosphatase
MEPAPSPAPPSPAPRAVIVWDWDWSAVNENTDVYVPRVLAPDLVDYIRTARTQWTALMDEVAGLLHARGVTADDIARALRSLPVFPEVPVAFAEAAAAGAQQVVVSDANAVYIATMAAHMGVDGCIAAVVTNGAHYDASGRLHIAPAVPPSAPHGCARCPVNLCKGAVLDGLRLSAPARRRGGDGGGGGSSSVSGGSATDVNTGAAAAAAEVEAPPPRVLYVGDGGGDVCAALRLGPRDVVAARCGPGFALLPTLTTPPVADELAAAVRPWADGAELLAIVRDFLLPQL